ncbi:MAG TPA: AI-2E family transporter [Vicinamibacteria bacterium]|nr:AI-2E family transporter [Vicinamibacteria bacterium]
MELLQAVLRSRGMEENPRPQNSSRIVFYGAVGLILWLGYRVIEPFLVEIGWAGVLAICLDPVRKRMEGRIGPTRTALVLTFLVVVLLVMPVIFVGTTVITEGSTAVSYLGARLRDGSGPSELLNQGWQWLQARIPGLPSQTEAIAMVTNSIGSAAQFVAGRAGGLAKGVASFFFSLTITLVLMFFLVRDWATVRAGMGRILPFEPEQNARLMAMVNDLVLASVTATLAIALIQAVIGGATFAILGIPGAVLWGVMIGFLALLPVMGGTLVWLPASAWLILSGSVGKGIVLLLVGVLILSNVDNVIRPLLLAGRAQVSTPLVMISLLGGLSAFGFIGIVVGPLIAALLTALIQSYQASLEPPVLVVPAGPVTPVEPREPGVPAAPVDSIEQA